MLPIGFGSGPLLIDFDRVVKVAAARKLLIVQDQNNKSYDCAELLQREQGIKLTLVHDVKEAAGAVANAVFDGIIADPSSVQQESGIEFIDNLRSKGQNTATPVLVISQGLTAEVITRLGRLKGITVLGLPLLGTDIHNALTEIWDHGTPNKEDADHEDERRYLIRNCFVEASQEVIGFYLPDCHTEAAYPKEGLSSVGYVSGMISFTAGGLIGSMAISFTKEFMPLLAEKVFAGMEIELGDAAIADLAGEMANQVLGKSKLLFAASGVKINIGLPQVVIGEGHKIVHKSEEEVFCIPVVVVGHICTVEVCMKADQAAVVEDEAPAADLDIGLWD